MSKIIEVKDLTKIYRTRGNKHPLKSLWNPQWKVHTALNQINFDIVKGESVALLGPNGAGKTTLTKIMTGIVYPTSGTVQVLGYKPQDRKKDYLCRIGLVMGNRSNLNWDLSARQNYWLAIKIYKLNSQKSEKLISKLANILDVEHRLDLQVRRTSLGERMKLELIGSILHDPEVLFLDEPTIGLDIHAKQNIRQFLRQIQSEFNKTIILTSHDMDDIEEVSDRVIIINKGQKVYDDSLSTLSKKYDSYKYLQLQFDGNKPSKKQLSNIGEIINYSDSILIKIPANSIQKSLATLLGEYQLSDITIEKVPLENIISDIFKNS